MKKKNKTKLDIIDKCSEGNKLDIQNAVAQNTRVDRGVT